MQLNEFRAKQTVNCYPTRAKVDECNLEYLRGFEHVIHAPCSFPTKTWHVQSAKGKHLGSAGCIPREFYGSVGCLVKLTANLHNPWGSRAGLFNGAMGTIVDILYESGKNPNSGGRDGVPGVVLVDFPHYRGPALFSRRPTVVPIFPVSRRCDKECCSRCGIPLLVQKATTGHSFQGSTVGEGCTIERIMIDPGDHVTEARWANLLYVMVTRAKRLQDLAFLTKLDATLLMKVAKTDTCIRQRQEIQRIRRLASATQAAYIGVEIGVVSKFKEQLLWLCSAADATVQVVAERITEIRSSLV